MIPESLVVLDFNVILDARVDWIGSTNTRINHGLKKLLQYNVEDQYRLDEPLVSQWTWIDNNGSHKSYLDRTFIRHRNRDSFSCPRFYCISYMNHKLVTCWAYL